MKDLGKLLNFGIIVIDKPSGPTSFTISDFVRNKLDLNKTSHLGTLDPPVSGVLPIALGRACKLTGHFLGHDKTYIGIIRTHKEITLEDLQKVIDSKFIGKIRQLPPRRSSVKRQLRERKVSQFRLLEKKQNDFLFFTEVQGGTYIRKLCSDLGDIIGGAHMLELRRIRAGIFNEKQVISLYEFERALEEYKSGKPESLRGMIIPAENVIKEVFEIIQAKETHVERILTGKPLFKEDIINKPSNPTFSLFLNNRFLGLYEQFEKGDIVAKPLFVFN